MTILTRIYLRASTHEQDASRARHAVEAFADEHGMTVAKIYIEHESGARLDRPKLFELLADCKRGDILLVEQVDRLSRLTATDWTQLRNIINEKEIRVVAIDLPTSHNLASGDEFAGRMLTAINSMLLDMLAAVARKDYEDRRRRQMEGQAKARAEGRYKGRQENTERNARILNLLRKNVTWSDIMETAKCSKGTLAKLARRLKAEQDDTRHELTTIP